VAHQLMKYLEAGVGVNRRLFMDHGSGSWWFESHGRKTEANGAVNQQLLTVIPFSSEIDMEKVAGLSIVPERNFTEVLQ
jgi:hypothetical protein